MTRHCFDRQGFHSGDLWKNDVDNRSVSREVRKHGQDFVQCIATHFKKLRNVDCLDNQREEEECDFEERGKQDGGTQFFGCETPEANPRFEASKHVFLKRVSEKREHTTSSSLSEEVWRR